MWLPDSNVAIRPGADIDDASHELDLDCSMTLLGGRRV